MKKWTSRLVKSNYFYVITMLFVLGIIAGVILFSKANIDDKESLINSIKEYDKYIINYKFNINHIILLILLIIFGLSVLAIPIIFFILFFEGVYFGYALIIFYNSFKIKGIIFYILKFILFDLFYFIIISILIFYSFKFIKKSFSSMKYQKIFSNYIIKCIILLLLLIINEIFIYYILKHIIRLFIFLI